MAGTRDLGGLTEVINQVLANTPTEPTRGGGSGGGTGATSVPFIRPLAPHGNTLLARL